MRFNGTVEAAATASAGCRRSRATGAQKEFKPYPIVFFRIDTGEVRNEEGKLHLFAAIDRTSKFVFAPLVEQANRVTASALLIELISAVDERSG